MPRPIPLLLELLVWAAIAEFLFLRVFLRLGPVLPVREPLLPVYRAVEVAGLTALNVALLAAAALAAALALRLLGPGSASPEGDGHRQGRVAPALCAGLVLAAVTANVGFGAVQLLVSSALAVAMQAGLSAAALLAALALALATRALPHHEAAIRTRASAPCLTSLHEGVETELTRSGHLALGLIVGAQLLALYYAAAQALTGWSTQLPGGSGAFAAAEALVVAAALALPWSYRPPWRRRHLVLGSVLGLALLGGLAARPWIVATLAMWTVSFSLFLPGALYAAALASAAATVWALHDAGPVGRTTGRGLLLVALAGLKLDFTYFALLALAGVLVLREPGAAVYGTGLEQAPQPKSASPGVKIP